MQPFSLSPPRAAARLLALILLVLAGLPGAARTAHAQDNIIYVNDNATGDDNGVDWANAYPTLYTAITVAEDGDEIWVAAGTYIPGPSVYSSFLLENGVAVYGGFAGGETLRTQRDWIANVSILNGNLTPGTFVFHVVQGNALDASAVLDGFTITGGRANGPAADCPDKCGGGFYLFVSSPTLANLIIADNEATYGAGMVNNTSNPTLNDVIFDSNTVPPGVGWGGGMYNYNSSPQLTDVDFSGNKGSNGAGIYNYTSHPTLIGGIFSDNRSYYDGGGMYNNFSSPTLSGVIFRGNHADTGDGGGGMYNFQSNPTLTNVTLSGNQGERGGGMYNDFSNPTLTNVTLSGNHAGVSGGGMANFDSGPVLTNVTLSGNRADSSGGGLFNHASSPLLQNSIIWGNSAPSGANIFQSGGGTTTLRYSLIEEGVSGGNNLSGDPLFVRAVNCGGDGCGDDNDNYGDLRLQPLSPALDVGDNGADLNGGSAGDATIASIPFDPNGAPRIAAVKGAVAKVDMGAYEFVNTVSAHAGGPYTGSEGAPIALNGGASSDEVPIPSYAWDCTNNGSVEATSPNPTGSNCTYADDGAFTLRLTATDVVGLPGSATAAVTIANVLPILTDPPNQSTAAATAKNFTLGTFADPGADAPWAVVIDWGDNGPTSQVNAASVGALPATPHTYAAAGTYNVVVTVSDDHGNGSGGFQVVVNAAPPGTPAVTAPAAQSASAGEAKSYALGSFSDAGDAGPWQVTVNWGDGTADTLFNTPSSGALSNQPHTYGAAGTYKVLVTVSDGDLAASASFQVSVTSGSGEEGSVAGKIFDDANGNGTQETGEAGIAGVQVNLSDENESVSASLVRNTTTASDGSYRFDNVPAGAYTLAIEPLAGYEIVGANQHQIQVTAGNTTSAPTFNLKATNTADGGLYLPTILR